jgi:diguanylate cyclase (GGDEF)-like protein
MEGDEPLSLLLADIDHFKRFNDTYGHPVGDQVLRLVARTLTDSVKGRDTPTRYGGEEFAIILPETSLEGAVALGETLRQKVSEHLFVFQADAIKVTISVGAALLQDSDRQANDLIKRADERLYAAKNGGRNRVCA